MDDHKTHSHVWDPQDANISPAHVARRIDQAIARRGWRRTMKLVLEQKGSLTGLRVVELGCGTGTGSLILGLSGASITLIDVNPNVLEATKKMYATFGCPAKFVQADCVDAIPAGLGESYDLVVSGGLAEHFTGAYRVRCIEYHRELLKEGGIALIGVPNRWSPFYQWIRSFRTLTGTWGLDVEVPFSNPELKRLAREAGFRDCVVIGSESLARDWAVYARGFASAMMDLVPRRLRESARAWKNDIVNGSYPADPREYVLRRCKEAVAAAQREIAGRWHLLADWFSAGLVLVGYR